ncbi:nitroreductase family protein [Spirulina sp. CS-785/01]|uniref:nitroreductase family protein n=1 Tax=Spirulina sp. CS-785/01 TaxID=3021716 RepID=UPI00232C40E3|nr:nitroreductase family protein [Spirulina sp. CS-785/01]MDB9311700.1 nitroreductase family protein [Spirulina sp. CS-785/01]
MNLENAIKNRRAARSFRSESLPDGALENLFELALYSPSGFNLQPWRFIILQEAASKEKLRACAFDQKYWVSSPVMPTKWRTAFYCHIEFNLL